MLWAWVLIFVGSAAVLVKTGVVLARTGDELAEGTGWGRLFVGMLLVAVVTSMPELVTGLSAVASNAPRLGVGDLLGSSMANMAILAVVDLLAKKKVWPSVELGQARLASVAIGLTAFVAMAMLTHNAPSLGWLGTDTLAAAGVYVAAVAWMRRSPISPRIPAAPFLPSTGRTTEYRRRGKADLRATWVRFAAAGVVLLLTGPLLTVSAERIASASGWGDTFVGASLLAVVTSLPELVAAVAAVRIGAGDMAVGNLFGSNAVNMALLVILDAAYVRGPLLRTAGRPEMVAAVGALLLMSVALAAIVHGERTRAGRLEPDAIVLLAAYVGCLIAVWSVRT